MGRCTERTKLIEEYEKDRKVQLVDEIDKCKKKLSDLTSQLASLEVIC